MTNYEVQNFEQEVIDASYNIPIVVDFWADWCGPCKMLEPIIIELAEENKEKWKLAKVDTDANLELAERYQIRGVPAIRIFYRGEIVAEFNGLMYKKELDKWLKTHLPDENKEELIRIKQLISTDRSEEAIPRLEDLVKKEPKHVEARVLLASGLILKDPKRASQLVQDIYEDSSFYPTVDAIRVLAELQEIAENPDLLEESLVKSDLLAAISFIRKPDIETGLEKLIEIVTTNKAYHNSMAPRACVALFTILGHTHPVTRQFRKRFDMVLY